MENTHYKLGTSTDINVTEKQARFNAEGHKSTATKQSGADNEKISRSILKANQKGHIVK